MFRREVTASTRDSDVLIDSGLADSAYVDSFGFEWTQIDGMAGKEVIKNLNHFMHGLPLQRAHQILDMLSDGLDTWREVDGFYAGVLANMVAMSFKHTKDWQKFQWFDGITPRYHWSLETRIPKLVSQYGGRCTVHRPGCFYIER